jgi:DNA sulfur modification protein DndB
MGMVVKLFQFDPDKMASIPVEQRTQRALKKNRVPEIADYVVDNEDYLFSSITVSVDTDGLRFTPPRSTRTSVCWSCPWRASGS